MTKVQVWPRVAIFCALVVASGAFASVGECASALVSARRTVEPDPALADAYEGRYATWRSLYPALSPAFRTMAG